MSDILLSIQEDISLLIDKSTEPTLITVSEPTNLQTVEDITVLNTIEEVTSILHSGITGPQGPAGPAAGEEEVAQAKRVDFINDNLLYRGEANPGTLDSAAAWRIRKIVIAADDDVTETWANGSGDYIHIWDNRLSYTYT
jgi:hypothetical protein